MMKEYATYFLRSIILGVKYLYFLILAILSLLTKQACALIMCVKRCWRSLCAGLVLFVLLLLPLAMSGEERSSMAPGRHCEWHGTSLDGLQLTMSNVFKCKWRKVCKGCQCYDPRKVMRLRLKAERKDAKRRPTPPTPTPTLDAEAADPKALLDAADLTPSDSSLFFVEASCASARAPLQPLQLTARQACAVESAARLHPERSVHLLVAAPRSLAADASLWSPPARALRHYPNVRVARVDVARYLRATPLQPLLSSGALARGHWPRAHAVSFIGYTTLWRFGGILLDLDFVVMKPLDGLTNFVAAETLSTLAPGALGTSCDEPGRRAATELLRSVYEDFDCGLWRDGAAVARMLDNVCNNSMEWPIEDRGCKEFQTLPPAAFFPVPWQSWQRLLLEEHAEGTMATLQGSYAVHMWEAWTAGRPVHLNSSQPYAQLARKFCPRVAKAAGPVF